jgi:hypothetical protein
MYLFSWPSLFLPSPFNDKHDIEKSFFFKVMDQSDILLRVEHVNILKTGFQEIRVEGKEKWFYVCSKVLIREDTVSRVWNMYFS